MAYRSPFLLLGVEVSPAEIDRNYLKRLRRKVLAEFELSDSPLASFGGVEMDKSQALALLDQLEDPAACQFHFRVKEETRWLAFLTGDANQIPELIPPDDPVVVSRLAPIWGVAAADLVRRQLKNGDFDAIVAGLPGIAWLAPHDQEQVLEPIERFHNRQKEQIDQFTKQIRSLDLKEVKIWQYLDLRYLRLLNHLPAHYQSLRNRYAESLIQLARAFVNQLERNRLGYDTIEAAIRLEVDVEVEKRVRFVYDQLWRFREEVDKAPLTGDQVRKRRLGLFGCLVGFVFLALPLGLLLVFAGEWFSPDEDEIHYTANPDGESTLVYPQRQQQLFRQLNYFRGGPGDSLPSDAQPYAGYYPVRDTSPSVYAPVRMFNASSRSAIFFVESEGTPLDHRWIAPQETGELAAFPGGIHGYVYTGYNWQGEAIQLQDIQEVRNLGAFGKPLSRLPGWASDSTLPLIEFSFFDPVPKSLRFDGQTVLRME